MVSMKSNNKDKERAELFDALGHPTRIAILKALSGKPFSFSELKKKLGIDSSGHLQHHLNKLGDLIKTNEYGKYHLSDQGRDALYMIKTVEWTSGPEVRENRIRILGKWKKIAAISLVALTLATILFANFYLATIRRENEFLHLLDLAASECLLDIKGDIDVLLYLLEYNNDTGVVRYKAEALKYNVDEFSYLTGIIEHYTGDSECCSLRLSSWNLYCFIIDVLNDEPEKLVPELTKNIEAFREISGVLGEMTIYTRQYGSIRAIPESLIEKLQAAVNKLSK